MFARRYFGGAFFGQRYFGQAAGTPPPPAGQGQPDLRVGLGIHI
jgi:hypothetical protein